MPPTPPEHASSNKPVFQEGEQYAPPDVSEQKSFIMRLAYMVGAKTETEAGYVLLGLAGFIVVLAIGIYFVASPSAKGPPPNARDIMHMPPS